MKKNKAYIETGTNRNLSFGSPIRFDSLLCFGLSLSSGSSASLWMIVFVLLTFSQCKQPYISPYRSPATGYLVVEGFISGSTTTTFHLSRTVRLSSDTTNPQEPGAILQIEGTDNTVYPLKDLGAGVYSSTGVLPLTAPMEYRLRIQTRSGGQYLSDFTAYRITPPIDSINWIQNADGVTIYANAHNDAGNTRYYQWDYNEIWEYHAGEQSDYEFIASDTSVILRPAQDQIYRCWQAGVSTDILITTTDKLAQDIVYEMPLRKIPVSTVPLSVLYYIQVRQYALTDSAYNYLSLMKKNTETLGTIFDPQPTQLNGGNIHCLTNSKEPVIGFVSAGSVQQQQIYISNQQVPHWNYVYYCPSGDSIIAATRKNFVKDFLSTAFVPVYAIFGSTEITGYSMNTPYCVDCRVMGGTTNAPSFWPN